MAGEFGGASRGMAVAGLILAGLVAAGPVQSQSAGLQATQGSWATKTPLPTARSNGAAVAIAGIGLLGNGARGMVPIAGTVLCGFANGAEGNLLPYFVSRYFGLRSFGQIFGYLFAVFMISVGVGPMLLGFSFDRWHSYGPMLVAFEIALLAACAIFLRFGAYRFPAHE